MLTPQKYSPKELNDLQECHTQLKKVVAALQESFPKEANKQDLQYQKFVDDLDELHFNLSMNLLDQNHLQETDLIEFRELLSKTYALFSNTTFSKDNPILQNAISESLDAKARSKSPTAKGMASSPEKTVLIQKILSSFESARATFVPLSQEAIKKSHFLEKPKGLAQIAYAVDFRIGQLISKITSTPIEKEYEKLLTQINKNINSYRDGNIKPIQNIIDLIDAFEETVKNDSSSDKEKHQALLSTMVGVRAECHIIEKNHHALNIQKELDEINVHLISAKNTAELKYDKALKALKVQYKQNEPPPTSGIGKLFQSINFVADQRTANYLIAKVDLDKRYQAELREIQDQHLVTHGEKIRDLTEQLNTLKTSGAVVISPISSASLSQLKSLAVSHGGVTIGNISQSRINALGSNGGACYGFSKEWILKMNLLNADQAPEHIMIDELNMYADSAQKVITRIANQSNVLSINPSTMKYYAEQSADKKAASIEYKKPLPLNASFYPHVTELLNNSAPSSLMINISSPQGGNHAMGVVKDHQGGIWFHDSNFCCVYFSNQGDAKAQSNFQSFFKEHMKAKYPEYTTGSFIHIKEKLDNSLHSELDVDVDLGLSSAPKAFLPAMQVEKEKQEMPPQIPPVTPSSTVLKEESIKPKT